jgi:hypothetical protein
MARRRAKLKNARDRAGAFRREATDTPFVAQFHIRLLPPRWRVLSKPTWHAWFTRSAADHFRRETHVYRDAVPASR